MTHIVPRTAKPASATKPMDRTTMTQVFRRWSDESENGSNNFRKRSSRPFQRSTIAVQRDCGCDCGLASMTPCLLFVPRAPDIPALIPDSGSSQSLVEFRSGAVHALSIRHRVQLEID